MKKWILRNWGRSDVGGGRWMVHYLDENMQIRPYASELFSTRKAAMNRAKFQNQLGYNVQVVCEHAFCENAGSDIP